MDTMNKNYGRLIEKIRKDRKISREELCDEIMSKRNYQRFIKGEVSISSVNMQKITDKLMLDTFSLEEFYKNDSQDEYLKLKEAYNMVTQWDDVEASKILASIDYDEIDSNVNRQLYDFTDLLIKRIKNNLTELEVCGRIENIIGYPDILDKKILNIVETNGLFTLLSKESKTDNVDIYNYLTDLVNQDDKYSYWLTNRKKAGIYAALIKSQYIRKDYEKCIATCEQGIQASKVSGMLIGLPNMFGHKMLSLNKIGKYAEALDVAITLYMHLLVLDDENKTNFYKRVINGNLKIDIEEIVTVKKEV